MSSALPVTILTGFLGAGKTTLINHLLTHYPDEKIVIIENEFGPISIDGGLLKRGTNIDVVELSNGCICCTVQGELTEALTKLIAQRQDNQLAFNRLIIETTGLADPAPILQTFFIDETIREQIYLDAVVTLVDSEHILKQLDEHRVALSQIGFADRIILTKSDRVDETQKNDVLARIHKINSKAPIYEAHQGQIDKQEWLDIQAFDLSDDLTINRGFFVVDSQKQQTTKQFKPFVKQPITRSWNDDIHSYLFEANELDIKKIGALVEQMIEQFGNDMLRYKGVLAIKNNPQRLIVQGVHKIVGFDYGAEWQLDEPRQSRLVVISRPLPFSELEQQFLACQRSD